MGFPIDNDADHIAGERAAGAAGNTRSTASRFSEGSADARRASPRDSEFMSLAQWISTAGGLGLAPIAPGTCGAAGGVLLFLVWSWLLSVFPASAGRPVLSLCLSLCLYVGWVALLFGLGVWASSRTELEWGRHDDQRIVIDEVVGQLIALSPLVWFFQNAAESLSFSPFFLSVVTGFVLFRVFDVWKPGAVRWAERRFESGLGVMADDLVAGLYSAIVLVLGLSLRISLSQGLFLGLVLGPFLGLVLGLGQASEAGPRWTRWSDALSEIGFRSFGFGSEVLA